MFRYYRTWVWGVFPASAIVAASVYIFNLAALPDPATADRSGLLRWLVFTELSEREPEVQRLLLNRLQSEFSRDGERLHVEQAKLTSALQERLERNLALLQQRWFFARCEQVCCMEPDARPEFLDQQIQFAERWGDLAPSADGPDVFDRIDQWIASAEGEQKRIAQDGVRWALHRFLQTRNLQRYPPEMQLELANRIVEDLEDGAQLDGFVENKAIGPAESNAATALDTAAASADMLEANGMLLIRVWLTDQAQQYARLDPKSQNDYLVRRLKQIEDWNVVSMFANSEGGDRLKALLQFSNTTRKWIEEAGEDDRPAMEKLFHDISRQITKQLMFGH